ncbi:hypothetical protein HCN51_21090 [Nonomuraea sp. FMUSA5-5]|uniref:Serine/threonine protein kinase n=1 Tax=Nonomuraea composti TaxID=2720023 RepID=A0ABX1B5W1_9ACTN|nr:hypothetical protein [Nonomuraea sp. FMUSA5-5]NJP91925.1 hypothetical protein [Nonomuraea sp. FMUSA5-5]
MEFQGWSDGLALRPRDYLGKGDTLAAVVRTAGPLTGEALYLFALGSATTMARLHLGGIAGLRLNPGGVIVGRHGQVTFAPGPRDSLFPAHDVKDWADTVVFAATGHRPGDGADLDRLLPALRAVIDECRRADAAARPSAVDLVRVLLGHSGTARRASAHDLLLEAERRTRPPQEPAPYEEHVVAVPFWRRPAYLTGIAIGIALVAGAAGAVVMISGQASGTGGTGASDVVSAVGRRTATFRQVIRETRTTGQTVAEGRLSFDPGAPATSYDMRISCGNDPQPTPVSLVGSRGVAGGTAFDADRPPVESCVQWTARTVRELSSPRTIKGLLDAAGTDVTSANGRTLTGSALAHRVRGEEGQSTYAGLPAEGPVRFTLQVDGQGRPVRLELRLAGRGSTPQIVETVYRDWRAFEAIKGMTTNG